MNEKLPCELIRDLLPSYHDQLTSDVTNQIVKTHLEECPACSEALHDMDAPTVVEQELDENSPPVLNFLRKVRRVDRWKVILCCVLVVVIGCGVIKFVRETVGHNVSDAVANLSITVDGDTIYVDGAMSNPLYNVTDVKITHQIQETKSGGYVNGYYVVTVYGTELRKSDGASVMEFHAEQKVKYSVRGVYLSGQSGSTLVWSDGEMISNRVRWFYDSVDEFMDDPTLYAEGNSDNSLGLAEVAVWITRELDDPEHPTTLYVTLKDILEQTEESEILKQARIFAYAFFSAEEEVQQVEVSYVTREEGESTVTFTREEADDFFDGDVYAAARTAAGQARVLRTLGIDTTRLRDWDGD